MNFNPLFIGNSNTIGIEGNKNAEYKFSSAKYLFSDIIKEKYENNSIVNSKTKIEKTIEIIDEQLGELSAFFLSFFEQINNDNFSATLQSNDISILGTEINGLNDLQNALKVANSIQIFYMDKGEWKGYEIKIDKNQIFDFSQIPLKQNGNNILRIVLKDPNEMVKLENYLNENFLKISNQSQMKNLEVPVDFKNTVLDDNLNLKEQFQNKTSDSSKIGNINTTNKISDNIGEKSFEGEIEQNLVDAKNNLKSIKNIEDINYAVEEDGAQVSNKIDKQKNMKTTNVELNENSVVGKNSFIKEQFKSEGKTSDSSKIGNINTTNKISDNIGEKSFEGEIEQNLVDAKNNLKSIKNIEDKNYAVEEDGAQVSNKIDKQKNMKTTNVELNENSVVGKNSFIKISNNASVNKEIVKHVDYKHLLNEISKGILSSEGKRIIFNLEPEHLGKIKITMSLVKELMSVKIEAESAEVKHYIESNIKQIEQQLIQQGGGNATISVSLMTQEQKSNSYFTKPKKKQSNIDDNKIDSKIEAKEENKSQKRLGYNTYEYLA